ncbi:MAG: diguanylate cyclase [Rhodocyclaceae bacterium]|nr:diguanylate cyclase [Rhodocyclaceae bacterium]
MSTPELSKFEQMKANGELPSPKGAALAIVRLTQRDDVSFADLATAVKTDPAFVGRLIKAANGASLGRRRPIAAIQEALTILGLPAVRGLALGFSLISSHRSGACRNFDYEHYWSKSLVRAIALQAVAIRTHHIASEEAFCLGLLSNIGDLALATLYPEEFSRILAETENSPRSVLLSRQRAAFVLDCNALTAAMLQDWGMPSPFIAIVGFADRPENAPFAEGSRHANMLQSLVLANYIAEVCMAPDEARRGMVPQLYMLGSRLSLDAETVTLMCDQVVAAWHEWGALLSLNAAALPPFEELSKPPPPPKVVSAIDPDQAAPQQHNMRVLIVDDDASMRAVLAALLARAGHEVFVASNGRQAFEMALDLRPQIMIADWLMPEMDGIELTVALRQTRIGRAVYIILLTGLEDDTRLVEAFEAGADDFISKPLKPRVLEARLRAGQRVVLLQQEIERDRTDIQRFAAELAVTNRRLQEMAQTDSLTGVPNRRYAMDRLQQEWAEVVRTGRSLACLVVDLDGFKAINDNNGHDVGDAALRLASTAMKNALRVNDVVCRTGGDEFLAICPDTSLEAAMVCADRVRAAVAAARVPIPGGDMGMSVSIGVAVRADGMGNPDALVKVADQGVYQAKAAGRDRYAAPQFQGKSGKK